MAFIHATMRRLTAPILPSCLLLTGEPVDDDFAKQLVDQALTGAASARREA